MKSVIKLSDGTNFEFGVNWLTVKMIAENSGLYGSSELDQTLYIIYAVMRSNGLIVTYEEALALMPINGNDLMQVVSEFNAQMEEFKKKQPQEMQAVMN